ncbi:acetyl-CoA carboxylase biotin carboxylase subunit [Arthrobacter sp. H14]|uniref:acetyl-CoA carboxylase biotin carboxylase subunit n=1 Tax=Arthrobacter sp. H14 TaxID=1312959 RepID=UPI00047B5D74|nr:acetyl-CoA carboxylase biotin carboxylase subunit [Arthrobacter sp. H14]
MTVIQTTNAPGAATDISTEAAGSTTAEHARTFGTVLVANRGEIACRIIGTLRTMGIQSVAVYSDADRGAKHVALADTAVHIGPAAPQQSYLNIPAILEAIKATGAEAVHPGYGFLSENEAFAQALQDAGVAFIGPSVHSLNVMGDKIRSKNHVSANSVPVVPGIAKPGLSNEQLMEAAEDVGYPLLIKPSAGGGGKGMHVVERPEDLEETLGTARRVAASAFGDDTLFLERLVRQPRHIEVQVLADNHGRVIHLGERECSLQRRHQKVIEEAPSPLLDTATRARIGEAACNAARSVDYAGAGTVEFLVSDASPDEFFFMEMNTRLQVEHPVTEMVTGLDLVEWQVRVAAGQHLALRQEDVQLTGHSIEARVYAENPERGFLPTTGTILQLLEPSGDGVRVDSSLVEGLDVGADYDPMLAKVIAWGQDRSQALARLDNALAGTVVLGLQTNIEYLRLLINDDDVQAGHLDTTMIERKMEGLQFRHPDERILSAAALFVHAQRYGGAHKGEAHSPWAQPSGWRIGQWRPTRFSLGTSATSFTDVQVSGPPAAATVVVGDAAPVQAGLQVNPAIPAAISISYDGVTTSLRMAEGHDGGNVLFIADAGFSCEIRVRSREEQLAEELASIARTEGTAHPDVRSPMPGTVIAVNKASGDTVAAGETILTVEAMKMEHQLTAMVAGTVSVTVKAGDLVKADQVVASIEAAANTTETADQDADTAAAISEGA